MFMLGSFCTFFVFLAFKSGQMFSINSSNMLLAEDSKSNLVSTSDLLRQIAILNANLTNATLEIQMLREMLKKCASGDLSMSDSDDSSKPRMSDEDEAKYKQYLLDFQINEKSKKDHWPWLDDSLYFGRLGGDNRIQYSEADAAIDNGRAEDYGRDRSPSFEDLDKSFKDSSYYGEASNIP